MTFVWSWMVFSDIKTFPSWEPPFAKIPKSLARDAPLEYALAEGFHSWLTLGVLKKNNWKFIQKHNFKFIELNYRPQINNLQLLDLSNEKVEIQLAAPSDKEHLADMAKSIFKYGRFHQDIALGDEIGNDRYKTWMVNAFSLPFQSVYKCIISTKIAGFFVVENTEKKCHWALTGLAPGLNDRGMGTRVWKSMMHFHQAQGVESITTSISSHNTAVLNLYAKLNFRFPTPAATFHWHR